MALGWMTILQNVPWSEVITHAPKVVEGARKLWGSVRRRPDGAAPAAGAVPVGAAPDSPEALAARLAALEAQVAALHQQMADSSELIQSLAEQNTQLVARVEMHRLRFQRLAAALGVVAVIAVFALAGPWGR